MTASLVTHYIEDLTIGQAATYTRTITEARALAKAAREAKVTTQMGNQGMAFEGNRLINEWIADDAIGPVREVHVWSDRPTHRGKMPVG